jgi:hypothetical protein
MTFAQRQFHYLYPEALVPPADCNIFWALITYWSQKDHEVQTAGRLDMLNSFGPALADRHFGKGSTEAETARLEGVRKHLAELRERFTAQGIDPDKVPTLPKYPFTQTDWPRTGTEKAQNGPATAPTPAGAISNP